MALLGESGGFKVMCSTAQADGVLHRPVLLFEIVTWYYDSMTGQNEVEVPSTRATRAEVCFTRASQAEVH
jgi:hypothetical protein